MDVLLVRPPEPQMSKFYSKGESLGLGYLAAVLRKNGLSVEIIDSVLMDLNHDQALSEIHKRDFAVLGFSVFALAMKETANLVSELRARGCRAHITLGGHFPTFRAKEILGRYNQFDSIVRYEGEYTLLNLVQNILSNKGLNDVMGITYRDGEKIIENKDRPTLVDLDSLPFPERDMLPYALKYSKDIYLSTSRGCWGSCTYCSISPFLPDGFHSPKWRCRSTKNVVNEIELLLSEYDHNFFGVGDSNFIGPGRVGEKRALDIADEIINRNLAIKFAVYTRVDQVEYKLFKRLKEAGMTTVYLGVESGVQSMLDRWKKNTTVEQNLRAIDICEKLGLHVEAGFMLYDPYTTLEEISQNLIFLHETGIFDFPNLLAKIEVRAGMAMEKQLFIEGRLKGDAITPAYDMVDPSVELFHSKICQILEPLSPVYLQLRDVKKSSHNIPVETLRLIMKRLNLKALSFARNLMDYIIMKDAHADNYSDTLRKKSDSEAKRLLKLITFFEIDNILIDKVKVFETKE
jgi:radical SAM superfamily enzyme YgiQ (UPF0313 family)